MMVLHEYLLASTYARQEEKRKEAKNMVEESRREQKGEFFFLHLV